MITVQQIRAARAMLNWTQGDLAKHCKLSAVSVANIENAVHKPSNDAIIRIKEAFKSHGICFIGDTGVTLNDNSIRIFNGKQGLIDFSDDVYETVKLHNCKIRVSGINEKLFYDILGEEFIKAYIKKLNALKNMSYQAICIGEPTTQRDYGEYKTLDELKYSAVPCYIYHNKLAHINLKDKRIIVISDEEMANSFAKQFDFIWNKI